MFKKLACKFYSILSKARCLDFIAPLAMRLYLAPVFWIAGHAKLTHLDATAHWFGNPDWGLGLPFPTFMAFITGSTEAAGAILLVLGLAVPWIVLPLLAVMFCAITSTHLDNGWLAIAHQSSEATLRLQGFLSWLEQNFPGRHDFITELGTPVMLNNGIEFAATYSIMLLALFFIGGGKFVSLDYWIVKRHGCSK